eukprot:1833111-Rhodomonas_salina.2
MEEEEAEEEERGEKEEEEEEEEQRHLVDLLGGHVVRGADVGLRKLRLCAQDARQAKVPELKALVLVDEDVGRLRRKEDQNTRREKKRLDSLEKNV